ncbi:MAG: hypothetical protein FWD65_06835, partial [Coriobacteriia bacterium]|nr:hypothetical protein [Coriobacteriia bacterium]
LTDAQIAALKTALSTTPVPTDDITALGLNNAKQVYQAAQLAKDALNAEIAKGSPDPALIEQLAREASSLEALGDRMTDQYPPDGELPTGTVATVDANGFAKTVDANNGYTMLDALNFPDPNLLALLTSSSGYDSGFYDTSLNTGTNRMHVNSIDTDPVGGDGKLSPAELNAVTGIYLVTSGVTSGVSFDPKISQVASLEGVELFPALTTLEVATTRVTTVSPDQNPLLTTLAVANGPVAVVNTANNPQLQRLALGNLPALSNIDLSKNTNLTHLRLTVIPGLRTFDATNLPGLQLLSLFQNPNLTSVKVSGMTTLILLNVSTDPSLTTLDVTGCTGLVTLQAHIPDANVAVSGNGSLASITGLTDCTALTTLNAYNQSLSSLDISANTLLAYNSTGAQFYNNNLTSLKVPTGTLASWQDTTNANNRDYHLKGNFGGTPSMTNPGDMTGVDTSKITQ